MKSAFVVGVVISGIVIAHTGWYIIDPIIGLLIAIVIIVSTWGLLRDSIRLSLDGVPAGTDIDKVEYVIHGVKGVEGVHHLHIWAISTTETALTAHIAICNISEMERIKQEIKHDLLHVGIQHATLEFEMSGIQCDGRCCSGK